MPAALCPLPLRPTAGALPASATARARRTRALLVTLCACLLAACQQMPQSPQAANVPTAAVNPARDTAAAPAPHLAERSPEQAPAPAPWLWDGAAPLEPPTEGQARPPADTRPDPADLWSRLRRGMRLAEPGGAAGQRVLQHERWYRQNAPHMHRTFTRARLYLHDIVEAIEREGMPLEIALLPAVESAFLPEARSHAAAEGLWQFIAPTGRRFDLKQHLFQDDRRAVRAATQAALRYLNELQARYEGDYLLALAAYNCGEGCIDRAVRQARAQGLPGRFEDLRLNNETAHYVPKLMGLVRVVAQAVDSGDLASASLPAMANAPYFSAVAIERDIDVKLAAELAGLSQAEFRALNPQHKRPVIVAAASTEVLVPVERAARFQEALLNHRGPLATWSAAQVARRSSVEALARQHGTHPQVLREVNQIPHGHLVNPGSTVVVPRTDPLADIPGAVAVAATLATVPAMVRQPVQVLRKDSWASLAERLGVQAAELKGWNPQLRTLKRGRPALNLPIGVAERVARLPQLEDRAGNRPAQPKTKLREAARQAAAPAAERPRKPRDSAPPPKRTSGATPIRAHGPAS